MKLLSTDVPVGKLLESLEDRLRARGLLPGLGEVEPSGETLGIEPRVDPHAFNLRALETHADPTEALPLHTHRGGLGGAAVLWTKRLFRKSCQLLINETLGRQRIFNGHVRDAYAQLSAEVARLRTQLDKDEARQKAPARKRRVKRAPPRRGPKKR